MIEYCTSCGINLLEKGFIVFPCPSCGKVDTGRCTKCRKQSNLYTCDECGFVGP